MTQIPVFSAALREAYGAPSSSLATDAMARFGVGAWMDGLRVFGGRKAVLGRIRTVLYQPRDGIRRPAHSVYSACDAIDPDDILVLSTGGANGWLFGENITQYCRLNGCAGMVTDAGVRDTDKLAGVDFPVFARIASARPANRHFEITALDVPVTCAGARISSGDLLVADSDGITIVPQPLIERLPTEIEDLRRLEYEQGEAIAAGARSADIARLSKLKKTLKGQPLP